MEFKDRLKDLRVMRDLTQQELADRIGVHVMTISGYERGIRKPDFETLDIIADKFNVSFDYLLGKSDVNTGYPRHGDAFDARMIAYASKLFKAYQKASPDTQAAVRAILHVEEIKDGDS